MFLFLFNSQATFKGWMDIMYAAVDSRAVSINLFPFLCPMHLQMQYICVILILYHHNVVSKTQCHSAGDNLPSAQIQGQSEVSKQ